MGATRDRVPWRGPPAAGPPWRRAARRSASTAAWQVTHNGTRLSRLNARSGRSGPSAGECCGIPQHSYRTGADGRRFKAAHKPRTNNDLPPETDDGPPPSTEPKKVPLCTSSRTVIADGLGRKVTHAGLAEAFRRDQELIDLATAISRVKTTVLAAKERDDPLFHDIMASQFEVDCGNLHRTIQSARQYTVCPYCGGDECKACKGRGWVNKMTYEMAPPEMKA